MFFNESRPDRKKRARKFSDTSRLINSPIPVSKSYELMSYAELLASSSKTFIVDIESYCNYFCVGFKCHDSKKIISFENDRHGFRINNEVVDQTKFCQLLAYILFRFLMVGFNSRTYDIPIIFCAIQGVQYVTLNKISNEIILQGLQAYEVCRKYGIKQKLINQIDLIEVAPISASLKIYSGRLHCERMQDLPFAPSEALTEQQKPIVRDYNVNDLDNTELLYNHLKPQIALREQIGLEYKVDLRSKSDAQIAETVIVSELQKLSPLAKKPNIEPGWEFFYQVPSFIEFATPQFKKVLEVIRNTPFIVGNGGSADCPEAIAMLKPCLGSGVYRLGIGGLHSSEESVYYESDETTLLIDRDVASYYPAIMLNQRLFPDHLGEEFLKVYQSIVTRRLLAKKEGNKGVSESLKIVINGTFGKLGNLYSKMYAPNLLTQVTMTGQLSLLMLIEAVELAGIPVISVNTDGIVMKCPKSKYELLDQVVMIWENQTGFDTEETQYKKLASRDVNNYIAIKAEGGCKTKGAFSQFGSALNSPLSKNPESYIISYAVQEFLEHGKAIKETIEACQDIRQFINVRTVKGGAEKNGVYLGKAIRWYYAKGEKGTINYVLSGNKVPKSEGAYPLMALPTELPDDLDFDYYTNSANQILFDIGYYRKAKTGTLL